MCVFWKESKRSSLGYFFDQLLIVFKYKNQMHMYCSNKDRMSVEKILGSLGVLSNDIYVCVYVCMYVYIHILWEHDYEFVIKANSNIYLNI